jgi:hypothetical protein
MLCHYSGGQSPAFKSEGPGFNSRSVNVGFTEDKVALVQVFPPSTAVSPVSIIPLMLHTYRYLHVAATRKI